jgi:regulator of cell morphogenesis and NO signaling
MSLTVAPTTTLAELVNQNPALARELEARSLDYCCGGRRSLAEACAEVGLDPDATAEALAAVAGPIEPADWVDLEPAAMVDHLERTHHAFLHAELPRLVALAEKVASVHGGRHPELAEVAAGVGDLRADLEPHLAKEEQVLFPMIRTMATSDTAPRFHCGSLGNPISMMLVEHDRTGDLLEQLRRLTDGYAVPDDGCASYRALYDGLADVEADTHLHVHKENNVLFPAVLRLEQERCG